MKSVFYSNRLDNVRINNLVWYGSGVTSVSLCGTEHGDYQLVWVNTGSLEVKLLL